MLNLSVWRKQFVFENHKQEVWCHSLIWYWAMHYSGWRTHKQPVNKQCFTLVWHNVTKSNRGGFIQPLSSFLPVSFSSPFPNSPTNHNSDNDGIKKRLMISKFDKVHDYIESWNNLVQHVEHSYYSCNYRNDGFGHSGACTSVISACDAINNQS